jgi:hypothetical protein
MLCHRYLFVKDCVQLQHARQCIAMLQCYDDLTCLWKRSYTDILWSQYYLTDLNGISHDS